MRIEIEAPSKTAANQPFSVRVILFNDAYEPVTVERNDFAGPNVQAGGGLVPPHVEATKGQSDATFTLQPFTFYGRERELGPFAAGEVKVTASYGDVSETVTVTVG
jgi:hypothetical protein